MGNMGNLGRGEEVNLWRSCRRYRLPFCVVVRVLGRGKRREGRSCEWGTNRGVVEVTQEERGTASWATRDAKHAC